MNHVKNAHLASSSQRVTKCLLATLLVLGLSHAGIFDRQNVLADEGPQAGAAEIGKESAGLPADPTQISPQISELLEKLKPASSPNIAPDAGQRIEGAQSAVVPIRLKGIILRDSEHGTAILEVAEETYIRVPLQRGNARTEPHQLSLDGQLFEIQSFNPVSLTLKNIESGQLRIIH